MRIMVTVYSKPHCPQCSATYRALDKAKVDYVVVDITVDAAAFLMVKTLGYLQAPVVITEDGEHWAGFRPDKIKALAPAELVAA
jgi:glutaredoxin-like protein NrdH